MNDTFYEQLVQRKAGPLAPVLKVLILCILAAALVFSLLLTGFWPAIIIIALAFLLYYFVFPLLSVEFEYTILNYDVDIDAVYSKTKRKRKLSFDLRTAELIAPAGSSALYPYRFAKTYDFTSHSRPDQIYSVILSSGQTQLQVLMEPDETTLRHFRQWGGSRFQNS